MSRQSIVVPDVYPPTGSAHAVVVDRTLYSAGMEPRDPHGEVVGRGDVGAQAEEAYRNLEAVLRQAGATWRDVVKVSTYSAPHGLSAAGRRDLQAVADRYLPAGERAGLVVPLALGDPDVLVAVEVIAHIGVAKRCVTQVPAAVAAPGWAQAVRVGDLVYVGGQAATGGHVADQVRRVYEGIGAVLEAAGVAWRDVVKVHQYATRSDVPFDQIRQARDPYLRAGEFLSTSVVCGPAHPQWPLAGWLVLVDVEAYAGPKRFVRAPDVWANPGGLHATAAGRLLFLQAQMSRDIAGRTLHPDDVVAHTELVFRNLNGMLRAAGVAWGDVVHVRTFRKRAADLPAIHHVRDRWVLPGRYANTDLVADFFDPKALVEIEVLAVASVSGGSTAPGPFRRPGADEAGPVLT
jgi:enamine deaminase RidA (YjgF/YER057c/UK114 family)